MLWLKFHVAALLDGSSRKLLTLCVFKAAPRTRDMLGIMKTAMAEHGAPRFIVTDHGPQFRKRFTVAVAHKRLGKVAHVKGKVHSFRFNGKLERFVRTLKLWQRVAVLFCGVASIQRALTRFGCWYNECRCHQALDGLTPEEAWTGAARPTPIRFLARDKTQHVFRLHRTHYAGDSHLPVFDIQIARAVKQSA